MSKLLVLVFLLISFTAYGESLPMLVRDYRVLMIIKDNVAKDMESISMWATECYYIKRKNINKDISIECYQED